LEKKKRKKKVGWGEWERNQHRLLNINPKTTFKNEPFFALNFPVMPRDIIVNQACEQSYSKCNLGAKPKAQLVALQFATVPKY